MTNDRYVRATLTVIAAALVYLCVVLTPLPRAYAQATKGFGAQTPGGPAPPGQVVVVGWQVPGEQALPVRVAGEVSVTGRVETTQAPRGFDRVILAGWEPDGPPSPGTYTRWNESGRGLPVVTVRPQP